MRVSSVLLLGLGVSLCCGSPVCTSDEVSVVEFQLEGARIRYRPPQGARELVRMSQETGVWPGELNAIAALELDPSWYSGGLAGVTIMVDSVVVPGCGEEEGGEARLDFARRFWGTGPDKLDFAGYRSFGSNPNVPDMTPVSRIVSDLDVAGAPGLQVTIHLASDPKLIFLDVMVRPVGSCSLLKISGSYRLLSFRDRRRLEERRSAFLASVQQLAVISQ